MTNESPALFVMRHGGVEVLEVHPRPLDALAPNQVLIEVAAVGVNFIDVYRREGIYPMPTPFVLCSEGAGTVLATGPDVSGIGPGDRVAWGEGLGSASTHAVIDAANLVPVPESLDLDVAAAAMLQGMTAHYLVNSTHDVQPGETALVHAAAGGVGQLLVQMIKTKGGTVIATAGSDKKREIARHRGADVTLDYTAHPDFSAQVREQTDGRGVDVVYDGVGAATFDESLKSLRRRGLMVLYGASSGQVPPFDLQRLNSGGSLFVTRPTLSHHIATREELLWRASDVLGALAGGTLHLEIGGRYPLDDAATAFDDLENRRTTGKLLLIP